MTDDASRRTFPADYGGVKLAVVIDRYDKGSRTSPAGKMHAFDLISRIVENAIRGSVELVEKW